MPGTLHLRLKVLLATAAVALGCWKFLPGSASDRAAFTAVARGFANPPFFIAGAGSHESPWTLRTLAARTRLDPKNAPLIVSLGDDPEGFFQSSPPSPVDVAVVLKNFQRLGARKAAAAAVLAWETPDPIALAALEKALAGFDALVTAAPLSRGSIPAPMPPPFRRASIPLDAIQGDTSALPAVNRIPVQGITLGGDNALAGFSVLEAESTGDFLPLVARWEDRAVFAFPLLAVLIRYDLPIEGIEIRLGQSLKLSARGPVIPIDAYGRLAVTLKPASAFAEISADRLIDGGDELFPKSAPAPVILRDDQSAAESPTRAFSKILSAAIAAIATEAGLAPGHDFRRLPVNVELGILAAIVLALTWIAGLASFKRTLFLMILGSACLAAQWTAASALFVWPPGISACAAVLAATALAGFPKPTPAAPAAPQASVEVTPPPEPAPVPVLPAPVQKPEKAPPARKAAKKAAKKAPAKKAAAVKTAAKKTPAKKRATRGKPPNEE